MVQSFNRVDDPVLDQSGSKLLGAAAGAYGGWKHHSNLAKKRGLWSKLTLGLGTGPFMRPVRTLAGAGLGALGAGVLARYFNKKHADRQERNRLQAYQQPQQPNYALDENLTAGTQLYDYGSNNYGGEPEIDYDFDKMGAAPDNITNESDILSKGLHGGLLGGLGGAILGASPLKGAGIGALGMLGYDLIRKHRIENELKNMVMQKYRNAPLGMNSRGQY